MLSKVHLVTNELVFHLSNMYMVMGKNNPFDDIVKNLFTQQPVQQDVEEEHC